MKRINTSFKPNLIVSLLIGGWLFLFIMLIRPFQQEPLSISEWLALAAGHSLIALVSYLVLIPLQKEIFRTSKQWGTTYELLFFVLFYTLAWFPSYFYHKSDFFNGIYSVPEFFLKVFIPSIVVVTPLIVFARMHLVKLPHESDQWLVIRGTYKLDYLKLKREDLVCISSSQNYVDVYYLEAGVLKQKTIRTSLKRIETELPELIRVHRSHLINADHLVSWKNANTLSLTQMEVPVSKNYKERLPSN